MDILLWAVVAWLLLGLGVAWMIGTAASMSDAPVGKHASPDNPVRDIDHFPLYASAQGDFGPELNAAAGTDRRRLRSM
jgi:hypothetical protein